MSKKQIKKLALATDIQHQSSTSDDEEEDIPVITKRVNKFALLEDSEEEKQQSEGEEVEVNTPAPLPSSSKKKPNKGNKKKKQQKFKSDNDDELLEAAYKTANAPSKNKALKKMAELLSISFADLNPDVELKKILGSAFRAPARQQGKPTRNIPSFRIIPKKPEWPSAFDSGIKVVPDEDGPKAKGVQYYRFQHSPGYQEAQQMFWDMAQLAGPEFQNILAASRYHVDTLLILAEQMVMHDDAREGRNLIEFAIYVCESAMPNGFEVLSPYTRFDYNLRENRAFFLALFRHIKFLIMRRCFSTALNVAKLIFLKDPTDPLGMHLMVDSLALKSGQYRFLLDYYETFKNSHNIGSLPNMLYSIAFANHFLALDNDDPDLESISQDLLFEAITTFPMILSEICDKMNVRPTANVSKALNLSSFVTTPPGLQLLYKIYVHHNFEDIWKRDGFMNWIEASVEAIVTERANEIKERINKLEKQQKRLYVGVPDAIARHAYLFDLESCPSGIPAVDPFPLPRTAQKWIRKERTTI